jgi:hypothetical protein
MPARPSNRQLDAQISPWPRSRRQERGEAKILGLGWRSRHTERRQVDVFDGAGLTFVRLFLTVDPASRDSILQGAYIPASSLMLRIPWGTYERVARHALLLADEGHLRFELRNGKLRLLGEEEPIVLGPLPPRQEHYREPRKLRQKRDQLEEVARIYKSNPRAPAKAVRLALGVSSRTAHRRVAEARQAGLIPAPTGAVRS